MKKTLSIIMLISLSACNGPDGSSGVSNPSSSTKLISYSILNTYPHDTSFFIQGLTFYNGQLYEGTGLEGKSKLMKIDIKTGIPLQKTDLDPRYFGEGIAILRDTIYQLTWQNKKAFAYTLKDFKKIKEFPLNTEGWGLTTDGNHLIASDGSSTLYYYEPSTFRLLRTQTVTEDGSLSYNLNELEYIDGFIYANQLNAPYIFKIDPASGSIIAKVDLTEMWKRVQAIDPQANVPNGIAYDSIAKKIYVTGKLWPELYEIELSK